MFPQGDQPPSASTLNVGPGQTIANTTIISLAGDGRYRVYNHAGSVDLIGDAYGYFAGT